MNAPTKDVVDPRDRLDHDDHMRGMEHAAMTVESIERPFPSVTRVTARIAPRDVAAWRKPNLAIRIEVDRPEGRRPVSRVYTIRSFDETRSIVEIDFVMHSDESPAMHWLTEAGKGTVVGFTGPRSHVVPAFRPGQKVAIFADETAIPAVHSILSQWPDGIEAEVYVETGEPGAFEELPSVHGVSLNLLYRPLTKPPGTTGRLVDAAKAISDPGRWTIWAACERQEARAIRRHFAETCGLPKDDVRVAGYWRRGVSSSDLDRARLTHYEAVLSTGGGLHEFDDLDAQL